MPLSTPNLQFICDTSETGLWTFRSSTNFIEEIPSLESTGISATQTTEANQVELVDGEIIRDPETNQRMALPASVFDRDDDFVVSMRVKPRALSGDNPLRFCAARNDNFAMISLTGITLGGVEHIRVYVNNSVLATYELTNLDEYYTISVAIDNVSDPDNRTAKTLFESQSIANHSSARGSSTQTPHLFGSGSSTGDLDYAFSHVFIAKHHPSDNDFQDIHDFVMGKMDEPDPGFSISSPENNATGVPRQTPFTIANGFSHHNLRVYEDDSGSPGSKARDVIFAGDQYTLTEDQQLDSQTTYHVEAYEWTPGEKVEDITLFLEDFDRADNSIDWDSQWTAQVLQGAGGCSISSGRGLVTADGGEAENSIVVATHNSLEVTNNDILITFRLNEIGDNLQPTFHFRTQNEWLSNNHIPSYWIYFWNSQIQIGRTRLDGQTVTQQGTSFTPTVDTDYALLIRPEQYRFRANVWDASGSNPGGWMIDWTDPEQHYLSGGFAVKNAVLTGADPGRIIDIDSIEVSAFHEEPEVHSITISPENPELDDDQGSTVTLSRQIVTTGGASENTTWSIEQQPSNGSISIQSQSNSQCTIEAGSGLQGSDTWQVKAESDFDPQVSDTVTGTVIEEAPPIEGGRSTDEATLVELADMWDHQDWDNNTGWSSSSMSLSNTIYGVTTEMIGGELRVTEINLRDNGINTNAGLPDSLEEITEMIYFNCTFNFITGPMRTGLFRHQKLVYCYLSQSDGSPYSSSSPPADPHEIMDGSGGGEVHPGKDAGSKRNNLTGPLPSNFDMPELVYFIANYMQIGGTIPNGLWNSTKLRFLGLFDTWMDEHQLSSGIGNLVNLEQVQLGIRDDGGPLEGPPFITGLPSELNNCSELIYARFQRQKISSLPDLSGMDPRVFNIAENHLDMEFPAYMVDGTWTHVSQIGFNFMDLSGQFPPNMPNNFIRMTVAFNNMEGSIPDSFWSNSNRIVNTDFSNNNFSGQMKVDLTNLHSLRTLRWANNNIDGDIPLLDWYNFYRQRSNGHPLRNFSGFQIHGNKYTTAHLNWMVPKFPWEIEEKPAIWYYQNKHNLISNVDPNFSNSQYINAGYSSSFWNGLSGSTGFQKMNNMLDGIFTSGSTGPGNAWNSYNISNQNP